ncbi:ABC transporter permease [Mesorhizobium sp. M00.F.Ca.ET.149.01.1.1]|nr:ABC transporter permease [Mesorhizobium sp. M8A.F.Ca.ET.197.01.1.1]TGR39276.1 ABC transporter permease [bacterium M00.F.Ca.ET.199.01.1.1]TGR46874.1 ABC transporter permease [Mesorhizobium sp. M8A.F.Ca.ET.198.01.1.1]TGV85326.1 ABC transporter permease [Mesorhizobium sp. M00.F.Ca.ET.149.01.1.1]
MAKPAGARWSRASLVSIYPLIMVVGLILFFSLRNSNFATFDNALNIGQQSAILLLVSMAGTIVVLIGSIDLSVGATLTLAGIVAAIVMESHGSTAAVVTAVALGLVVGAVNGVTMLIFKVPSFLVTLGTMSILSGITNMICNGSSIIFTDYTLVDLVNAKPLFGIPVIILVSLAISGVLVFVASKTVLGRYLFAIGGGEQVAAHSGVPVTRYKIYAFMLCGALAGLSGIVLAAQIGAATPAASGNIVLDSIAAIVMGGTALSGGIGGPHRTLLGVLVVGILSNGMDVTGVSPFTQQIVKGFVIILAVASTIDRRKYEFIK